MISIERHMHGYTFGVSLDEIASDGELANGATAWRALVTVTLEGRPVGQGIWDGEGFSGVPALLPSSDDTGDVYGVLARAVRRELASYTPTQEGGLALAL